MKQVNVSIRYSRFLQTGLSTHVLSEQVRRQTEQLICPLLHQRQHKHKRHFIKTIQVKHPDWSLCCTNICWSDLITRTLATSSWKAMKFRYWMLTMSGPVTTVSIRFSIRPTRFPTSSSSRSFASWGRTAVNRIIDRLIRQNKTTAISPMSAYICVLKTPSELLNTCLWWWRNIQCISPILYKRSYSYLNIWAFIEITSGPIFYTEIKCINIIKQWTDRWRNR